jgi:hypothetical protein
MPVQQRQSADGKGPVHTIRHRNLKATIWRNETDKGVMYNVTLVRSWRDESGEWADSNSFGYDDLMNVSALLYEAHAHISELRAKENMGRTPARSGSR